MPELPRVDDLIGIPFAYGGRGPHSLDCYGLIKLLHQRMGIDIPEEHSPDQLAIIEARIQDRLAHWRPCAPRPGSVILFRIPCLKTRTHPVSHMAFQTSTSDFIHAWQPSGGVTIERLGEWSRRIAGHYLYQP